MEHGLWIVLAMTAVMGGGVGMFFQLAAPMFSCFEGGEEASCYCHCHWWYGHALCTHNRNEEQVHSTGLHVCVFLCDLVQAFAFFCVYHLDVWGRTQLKFKPGPPLHPTTTLPPLQPLQSWPWLILLSFTFLSEIYYLLPWLVFYGLMTSNRSHHQGQLQLHPLCLCSSMSNLVCCLCFLFVNLLV